MAQRLGDELQTRHQAVQGRPQLVADRGEEDGLGGVGFDQSTLDDLSAENHPHAAHQVGLCASERPELFGRGHDDEEGGLVGYREGNYQLRARRGREEMFQAGGFGLGVEQLLGAGSMHDEEGEYRRDSGWIG
jgi:hypothetical protein